MRVCLVGYLGYWAKNLKRTIENTKGIKLTALVDQMSEEDVQPRIMPVGSNSVSKSKNLKNVLKKCDAVVVATPPETHYQIAKEAILAGKHVLVEKPMTTKSDEAKELVKLASKCGVKLAVDHTFLFSQHIRVIKSLVGRGKIGKPLRIVSNRLNLGKFQDSGVIWDLAPHDIAMTNWLMGKKPVVCSTDFFDHIETGVTDTARIGMRYGDTSYDLNLSWLFPKKVRNTIVVGTEGMIEYDMLCDSPLKIYDKKAMKGDTSWAHSFNWVSEYQGEAKEPLAVLMEEFRDYCIDNKEFVSDGELGVEVVETIEEILRSQT